MNQFKKYLILAVLAILAAVGCQDYLEVPVNGIIIQDNYYESDNDVNAAILTAYDILTWNNNWDWGAPVFTKTLPSDEGTCGGASPSDQAGYNALDDYTYDSANDKISAYWNLNYFGVHRCNTVLDYVEGDTDFKAQAIAEAHGLRAYYYLELVTLFGDLPILTTTQIPVEEYSRPRSSVAEVYALIESDLNTAIAALPTKSEYGASDQFRISKGTCQGLLAKAQVYQGKYSEALATVQEIVNSGEYALAEDFATIFKADGEFGSGSMFEAVFTSEVGYNWGTNPWDLGLPGGAWEANMHIQLMGPREGAFGDAAGLSLVQGWGFNYPSEKLYNAYIAAGDEERRLATVITEQEWIDGGGTATGESHDYNGFLRTKYGSDPTESNDVSIQQNYGTNWRLLRYADILLIGAEAAANAGDDAQAQTYLNQVRTRAGLDDVTATGDALMDAIMNERFLELAFEGFRFHDLIRWGVAADNIEGFVEGKHNLFPIPNDEIVRAGDLTQNPGW
ncbi:MAG: RagB/SusD family nutrient uptake outer membrane protein [Bacteroidota bacterium]